MLLAGVNDDILTLTALMRGFVEARIKPYYLHQLDLAPGTAHFRVGIEKGRNLMRECVAESPALPADLHARSAGRPRKIADRP